MNELVCVSEQMTAEEAHVAKLALQEVEIPCFLADSNCAALFSYALGGVKLMVPANQATRATQILSDAKAGRFAVEPLEKSRRTWLWWSFLAINIVGTPAAYLLWILFS